MARECLECGCPIPAGKRRQARFCSAKCKRDWNNRRAKRGAELYDLVMIWRFERDQPNLVTIISNLARAYRDADVTKRAGRKSWDSRAMQRLPLGYSKTGDKR